MATKPPHVALLIETSRSYGRGLLGGVRRYLAEQGPWSVFMELRALNSSVPLWLRTWRGDGILTRSGTKAIAQAVRKTGVPAVELRSPRLSPELPWVGVDNGALGTLVAGHLLERGFRNFAVLETSTEIYFEQRRVNFIDTVRQAGYECSEYSPGGEPERPAQWERYQNELVDWVQQLPKPVGVMACTDQLGFFLLDACNRAEVGVPEEVAVVGVENEETLCTMASPTLSSVKFNAEEIGYQAAAILDRMMQGEAPPAEPTLVPPLGIEVRGSSDVLAIEDREVAQAMRYIREHVCERIAVADVLEHVPLSRSSLERRMRSAIGRTPNEEIKRVRLEAVKQLLLATDLPLNAIARRTGFTSPQYLVQVFREELGQTPGEFRNQRRQ